MTLAQAKQEILDLAVEDRYGLWELAWRLAAAGLANPGEDAVALARAVTLELLNDGLITIADETGRPSLATDDEEARRMVASDAPWRAPDAGVHGTFVVATASGRTTHRGDSPE